MKQRLTSLLPPWLPGYRAGDLSADMLAGALLAILLIPQAMAYALLAGLPAETGLYAAMVPPLLYALIGGSAFVSVGPMALVSLLVADALAGSALDPKTAAAIIAVEAGLVLLLLGFLRLGRLVNFISDPALLGFTAAAALLIAASQLPAMLGIVTERSGNLIDAASGILAAGMVHMPTIIIGVAVLALLVGAGKYGKAVLDHVGVGEALHLPILKSVPLLVIIVATVLAGLFAPDVRRLVEPDGALPPLGLVYASPAAWLSLLPSSLVIAVIAFVSGAAVAKSLSSDGGKSLDTSREAIAVGAANVAAGITGGYASSVSFSRSALVLDSGGRSPLATAFAALIVLPVVLYGGPALAMLPEAALAALVVSTVFGLVKLDEIRAVFRHSRSEGAVLTVTLLVTVLLGVRWGLLVGALSGIAVFIWFASIPNVTRIGLREKDWVFRSVDVAGVEVDTLPVLGIRIDRSIYFANAAFVEAEIEKLLARHDDAGCLLLDMRAVNSVDATGIRMVNRLIETLHNRGISVAFAAMHEAVEQALDSSDSARTAPHFLTFVDGLKEMRARCGS